VAAVRESLPRTSRSKIRARDTPAGQDRLSPVAETRGQPSFSRGGDPQERQNQRISKSFESIQAVADEKGVSTGTIKRARQTRLAVEAGDAAPEL
jgi:hypothetical protein